MLRIKIVSRLRKSIARVLLHGAGKCAISRCVPVCPTRYSVFSSPLIVAILLRFRKIDLRLVQIKIMGILPISFKTFLLLENNPWRKMGWAIYLLHCNVVLPGVT